MSDISEQIAGLSPERRRLLDQLLKKKGVSLTRSVIMPCERETNAFLPSFVQQRLWFLDRLEPGSCYYNMPQAMRLTGRLDMPALERAINEIVRRHEILRTTFSNLKGKPIQVISPVHTLDIAITNLAGLDGAEQETETARLVSEEARRPFDLACGPLLRVSLLRLSDEDHVVVLTMHHIISDGWSMDILIREMATLYRAFVAGDLSPLRPLPLQYVDFASWQREWLQGEYLADQLAYWKERLQGISAVLELPLDYARPAVQTSCGSSLSCTLPASLCAALKALGRQEKSTLFMVLLAAFQTLLYRYSRQEDICVGTPIANRNRAELEDLIGFFVNTLVLRGDLSGAPSFRELLRRVRESTLEAYAHQDLPFEMLVEALQPERDLSYAPLFQVMFVLQNAPPAALALPGLTLSRIETHSGTAKFDLMLVVSEESDTLTAILEYRTDLFDPATISRMLGHWQTLLAAIVLDPDQPISLLPLLTDAERRQLLVDWNNTDADFPREACLQHLFEAQVCRTPEANAVFFEGDVLTFTQLNRQANQLAHYLRTLGVGPDVLVGLCMQRSPELIIGLLAILKAGGAYLPLDPAYPAERLAFMLADTQVAVLVSHRNLLARLPAGAAQVVYLDAPDQCARLAQAPITNPTGATSAANLAYVIYTSGSTGKPKGVMIPHRAALNLWTGLQMVVYATQPAAPRRVSLNAPLAFDASVQEWVTLLGGHCLYIIPEDTRLDGRALLAYLRTNRLDVFDCVPSQLKLLLQEGLLDGSGWIPPVILPGGEAIDETTWQRLRAAPGVACYNMYGPTECAVDSTICPVSAAPLPSIGRPICNTQHYILDAHLQPVPVGVPGELYIGGAGLGRGYLNRPELAAERFIPHPFGPTSGRLYKTGDLVRYRADGYIEYLGRLDHQVKVRGFRIELGEIEAALLRQPGLREAVVVAREEPGGARRLVAYVVPEIPEGLNAGQLRSFLKGKLPDYMLPSAFVILEALPLTPNGKLDRRALPDTEGNRPELDSAYVAPRGPMEEILAGIWAQVLGIEQVGVRDNFFELGGHSLMATQVTSRLRDIFHIELPVRKLFESPTVAYLSRHVEAAVSLARGSADLAGPPIEKSPRDHDVPLSFAQQRLWFLNQLEPGNPSYNMPTAIRLRGVLNVPALERSLNEVIRRHEVLRTTFPTTDGKAVQMIAPEATIPVALTDLRYLPQDQRQTVVQGLIMAEASQPFDLARGPLVRAHLFQICDEEHVTLLTMHHIVGDGWSMGLLTREIAMLYNSFSTDSPSPMPELPIQYADFALWQRRWLRDDVLETELSYWTQQLQGFSTVMDLPTDRPRPSVQSADGGHLTFQVAETISHALQEQAREQGVTLFMMLLAAFQALLYRYTGQVDMSIGTPIANRNRQEIEGLIGFFVNTLVMRGDLSGDPSFGELLRRTRDTALEAYAHQDLPFELLVDALQPQRDLSHTPLFQVMFVFQNTPPETLELPGMVLSPLDIDIAAAAFDLTLTMAETPAGLSGAFEYNKDLFNSATIERMVGHFQTLLDSIAQDTNQHISELPLLTESEGQHLLQVWNDTRADYPLVPCMHQLFEAQVAKTPDAIAVVMPAHGVSPRTELSYEALNRRANQLAHYLRQRGIGAEALVGLWLGRSVEMIVGLLGILKAGAAYVPLDPSYPRERLDLMLEDAQMPAVVTNTQLAGQMPDLLMGSGARAACEAICLDASWNIIAQQSDQNPADGATAANNAAYVIYTSGSTGRPKGVVVEHGGVVNHNLAMAKQFDLRAEDRVLQFATLNFDGAVEEIFPTWSRGATLVLRPDEVVTSGTDLLELVRSEGITVLDLPTAYWHEWVYELALAGQSLPPSLRLVIVGGDKALAERYGTWQKLAGGQVAWLNTYGPTEGTIIATQYDPVVGQQAGEMRSEVPIGRPIANVQVYLLDRHLRPVPVGVPGELYIGGAGVARGYLNRPELTAESFIPDPFWRPVDKMCGSKMGGARLYKTGDMARYRPDGNIEFLGRVDHQVKVRGFRVELGEIEAALLRQPGLREAVVVAREEPGGVKRLVAYVVPEQPEGLSAGQLRNFLKGKLPDYMLPSAFVILEALPLTPNGKVDRRALPDTEHNRPELETSYTAAQTPVERILAGIWAQVLGIERVGVHDNFFELGGDSILSIQVIARANQAGVRLTPRQLFEHPTVGGLAEVAGEGHTIEADQGIVEGLVPLTPIQGWFFEQEFPQQSHWNQALLLEVHQYLQPDLLREAIKHLMEHHDVLRTRFWQESSGWQQAFARPADNVPLTWGDLSRLHGDELGKAIEAEATQLQIGLNLETGPVWRVAYLSLGAGRPGRLLMVAHHLVVDGVSWRILLEDVQTAYQQLARSEPIALPAKTTSFKRWAQQLAKYAQSQSVQEETGYWLRMNASEVGTLPLDCPDGANIVSSARSIGIALTQEETQALLHEVPAAYHTEINDALLTALAEVLAAWTGKQMISLELEGHGREHLFEDVDISRTVGWFTTIYPVQLDLRNTAGTVAALKSVREQLRRIPRRGIHYGLLRYLNRDTEMMRRLMAQPAPEVSFNYLGQLDQELPENSPYRLSQEARGPDQSLLGKRTHLLEINGGITSGRLHLEWTYCENLHRRSTIERVAESYLAALRSIIAHARRRDEAQSTSTHYPMASNLSKKQLEAISRQLNRPKQREQI